MSFKFAGTSLGNSTENHSATVSDGYINGPSRMGRNIARICRARCDFHLLSKLGHTPLNPWWTIALATDCCWGLVVSLTSIPNPTRLGYFKKSQHLKPPTPSFQRFSFLFLPFTSIPNFQLPTFLLYQLITSLSPQFWKSPFYWSESAVVVCSWYPSASFACISPLVRYVSLISTHLHCIFVF